MQNTWLQKSDVRRFHNALEQFPLDRNALYHKLGISPEQMRSADGSIPMAKFLALLEAAADAAQMPFLGMQLSLIPDFQNVGILKYIVGNASSLAHALDSLHRFVALVSPGSHTELTNKHGSAVLTYSFTEFPPNQCRQDVEATLVQYVQIFRYLLAQPGWQPERLYFQHDSPSAAQLSSCPLSCELIYNHTFSGVAFPSSMLDKEFALADPDLYALLENQASSASKSRAGHQSFVNAVRSVITSTLGLESVTAETVAHSLHCSKRTLYRRLGEQSLTFGAVYTDVVSRLAKSRLVETDIDITQLALTLGYADATSFIRAFKRTTGETPARYRQARR